ncbi:MAG: hypothetical protein ACRYG4_19650 [Janthinobacterium lividum]
MNATSLRPRDGLILAIDTISAATIPLLLVEQSLIVLAVSDGFCRSFAIDRTVVPGRSIFALGSGEWATPLIRSLLTATMSGGADIEAHDVSLQSASRGHFRLRFDANMIHDDSDDGDLMLVTVTDLDRIRSRVRERDDLKREKADFLRDLRQRIARSPQIVASVPVHSVLRTPGEHAVTPTAPGFAARPRRPRTGLR